MSESNNLTDKGLTDLTKLVRASVEVRRPLNGDGIPFVVYPTDYKVSSLAELVYNEHNPAPDRVKEHVKLNDPESFVEYYKLFHDENSRVFANEAQATILGILDYHGALAGGGPRWGSHKLQLTLKYSKEWTDWTGANSRKQTQVDFAEFIEDHSVDVIDPGSATMIECARDVKATADIALESASRQQNGSVQFKYSEQVKGTYGSGGVDIPEVFVIQIPVYLGGAAVSVKARLRFRINGGKLQLWYDLFREDQVQRDAFRAAQRAIGEALGIVILNGTPA